LDGGVSPFSIVLVDNTTRAGEITYQPALQAARKYDELAKGVNIPLEELNTVQNTKANIQGHSQQQKQC
jgi:hypothetical protein